MTTLSRRACGGWLLVALPWLAACGDAKAPPAAPISGPPAIRTAQLADVAIRPLREAPAQVQSLNTSRLAAEVSARIEAIPVDVGQAVERGDVVVRLDARDLDLAVARAAAGHAQAQARRELAVTQLRRARELQERKFVSPDAMQQRETELALAEADLRMAQATLDTARRQADKAVLRAPFAAIVQDRTGQVGELAAPGVPLLTLLDRSRVEVAAQVQPKDIGSLRVADPVQFVTLARERPVRLIRISPVVTPETRQVEARLRWAAEGEPPGSEGRLVWRDDRLHLPPRLLVRRDGRAGVFVAEGDKVRFVPVDGAEEGRPVPTTLPPTATVVVAGGEALQDGQPLLGVPAQSGPAVSATTSAGR